MLLSVLDGNGTAQKVITNGQTSPNDVSGVIASTGVSQLVVAANVNRSGFVLQNNGSSNMYINELGLAASSSITANNGSWTVPPGGTFPPSGWAVTTAAINILGTATQAFTAREW